MITRRTTFKAVFGSLFAPLAFWRPARRRVEAGWIDVTPDPTDLVLELRIAREMTGKWVNFQARLKRNEDDSFYVDWYKVVATRHEGVEEPRAVFKVPIA